jgi:hypothetical protein
MGDELSRSRERPAYTERPACGGAGTAVDLHGEPLRPVRMWRAVVVGEAEDRTARGLGSDVARSRGALARSLEQPSMRMACDGGGDGEWLERTVVDDDHLETIGSCLGREGIEATAQGRGAITRRNDDRELRRHSG